MKPDLFFSLISRIRGKAHRLIVQELERNNLKGLAPSHGDILFVLFARGPVTMKELAFTIDRDKSTVTALVNKLEKSGFIEKRNDSEDRRIFHISLTRQGKELKPSLIQISRVLLEKIYAVTTEKERVILNEILSRINDRW